MPAALPAVTVGYAVAALAYAGFQWTVQVLVYRQFPAVPAQAFPAYESGHARRVVQLVAPLFLGLAAAVSALLLRPPDGVGVTHRLLAAGLLAVLLGVTGLRAAPLHRRLARGYDAALLRRLLRWDAVRTAAATGQALLAVRLMLG